MSEQKKKSSKVPAVLVTTMAALMIGGCSQQTQVRRCIDDTGKVLDDQACNNRAGYRGHYIGAPHFVYGGSGGNTPGSMARGFTSTPSSSAKVVTPNGTVISRGGFGSSGSGRSSGGFFGG